MQTESVTTTATALKEWAVVCDLLLRGAMQVLFRKGGIDEKGFWVEEHDFALFPTYFHQNRDKVRPEFLEDFDRAMASAPPDGLVRVPGVGRVAAAIEVAHPERIHDLQDLHPYTPEQIDMRLAFRPKKPLVVLVVEARRLEQPLELPARAEFGGCSSWVPLGAAVPLSGDRVTPPGVLQDVAGRIRSTVG